MKGIKASVKVALVLLLAVFFSQSLYAHAGFMAGAEDLRIVSTKYFDIIYPQERESSASLLVQNADSIYEEIAADYSLENYFRLPVVITTATDVYNAYYTNAWYNHIVLFDTMPDDSMNVFYQGLLDTFKHELTHAISINMRAKEAFFIQNVFGDVLNWGDYLVMTSFMKEGAAVAEESKSGAGRLHDGFYLHTIRQSKLQNTFPSYADVTGSRDTFPANSLSYAFGGPFTEYVQKKYGMEKYARFWYTAVNFGPLTYSTCFEYVYGKKIKEEWKEFKNSVYTPEINANPLAEKNISEPDFFKNKKGSWRYDSFSVAKNSLAFVEFPTGNVYLYDGKLKKLFSSNLIESISLSSDGKFLAVNSICNNHAASKTEVSVYDIASSSFHKLNLTGVRDSTIVIKDGEYFLASVFVKSQIMTLEVRKIILDGRGRISSFEKTSSFDFPMGDSVTSIVDAGDGNLAFIHKKNLSFSVELCDISFSKESFKTFTFPVPNARIQNLAPSFAVSDSESEKKTFTFSWADENTFPRLGLFSLSSDGEGTFKIQKKDISGGVYNPVMLSDGRVFFKGNFVTRHKVFVMETENFISELSSEKNDEELSEKENSKINGAYVFSPDYELDSKAYRNYLWNRGLFLPAAVMSVYDNTGMRSNFIAFPGFTWQTSNPWDSDTITLQGGYDNTSGVWGASAELSRVNDTSVFSYALSNSLLFEALDFLQNTTSFSLSSNFNLTPHTYLSFAFSDLNFVGRRHDVSKDFLWVDIFRPIVTDTKPYEINQAAFAMQWAYSANTGAGVYERFVFVANVSYYDFLSYSLQDKEFNFIHQISPTLKLQLPWLFPIFTGNGITFNLPLIVKASLYPTNSIFLAAEGECVLFATEIQKGLTFFPLYFNRFFCTLSYYTYFAQENRSLGILNFVSDVSDWSNKTYVDSLCIKLLFTGTYNSGGPASPMGRRTFGMKAGWSFSAGFPVLDIEMSTNF